MLFSFDPIVDVDSKILILGSMPGVESLLKREYYGNGRNQFWSIVFSLFGGDVPESYNVKVDFLLEKRIALWDVLRSCEREGSLDSAIRNATLNPVAQLLDRYVGIRRVFFNGLKAESLFRGERCRLNRDDLIFYSLPSTSPAYTKKFGEKLRLWGAVYDAVQGG